MDAEEESAQGTQIDLLLYNRRLRCLVALNLILGRFRQEYAGAMNFYLNYLETEEMEAGDNPPIGIQLCSGKNVTHVEYALGGRATVASCPATCRTYSPKKNWNHFRGRRGAGWRSEPGDALGATCLGAFLKDIMTRSGAYLDTKNEMYGP